MLQPLSYTQILTQSCVDELLVVYSQFEKVMRNLIKPHVWSVLQAY